jgi:hypothetical protein
MEAVEAQRTLVKSIPELWAALSGPGLLDGLLHEPFGEIHIARLRPETQIDWESDLARGSVELATSVLGTRMRLTAEIAPPSAPQLPPVRRNGLLGRLLRRRRPGVAPLSVPTTPLLDPGTAQAALDACLDEVGTPRHRPFSRHAGAPEPRA